MTSTIRLVLAATLVAHIAAQKAVAETNRAAVKSSYEDGWTVVWGKELDHVEYVKCAAAITASVAAENPAPLQKYFESLAEEIIDKFGVMFALRVLQGGAPRISGDVQVQGGIATYNHWKDVSYDFFDNSGKWKRHEKQIPFANTHQLYIRYRAKPEGQAALDPTGSDHVRLAIHRVDTFHIDADGNGGNGELNHVFGVPGDIPVSGDWDGDGKDGIGIFRDGAFFLDNNRDGTADGNSTNFGADGDVPVVGDWNGDGKDDVGVYRNGIFHLDENLSGGEAEAVVQFGAPSEGDIPVIGDWDGDGKDEVGVYRHGRWFLDYDLTGGPADTDEIGFGGAPQDKPLVGDWNNDGKADIGIFRDGIWHLDLDRNGGPSERMVDFGVSGDFPLALAWN